MHKIISWHRKLNLILLLVIFFGVRLEAQLIDTNYLDFLHERGKFMEAKDYLSPFSKNNKNEFEAAYFYWHIKTEYELGHYKLANQLLDDFFIKQQKENVSTHFIILGAKVKIVLDALEEANNYLHVALNKKKKTFLEEALILDNLGLLAIENENYSKADSLFRQALEILEMYDNEHDYLSIIKMHLGEVYLEKNNFSKAKELLETAEIEIRSDSISKITNLSYILNHLGRLYLRNHQFKKAEQYFKQSLNEKGKILSKQHPNYLQVRLTMARLYKETGKLEKSEKIVLEIEPLYEEIFGETPRLGRVYLYLGSIKEATADYDKAILYYEKVKKILLNHNRIILFITASNDLATVYWSNGNNSKAEQIYLENYNLAKEKLEKQHYCQGITSASLGVFYDFEGKTEKAEKLYNEALPIIEKTYGKKHNLYTSTAYNLGWLYQYSDRYELAEKYYLEVEKIEQEVLGKHHPNYLITLYGMAGFYRKTKQDTKAIKFYKQANQLQIELIQNYYSSFDERTRIVYLKKAIAFLGDYYSFLVDGFNSEASQKEAQLINLTVKGLALDYHQYNQAVSINAKDSILKKLYVQYQTEQKKLSDIYTLSSSKQKEAKIDLEKQRETVILLEKKLTRRAKTINQSFFNSSNYAYQDLQNSLKPKEATIDYIKFDYYSVDKKTDTTYYYALLTQKNHPFPHFIPLCQEKDLKSLLQLSNQYGAGYTKHPEIGQELYNLIWQPLEPYLKDIKTIHLSPTGLLHKIALGGLPYKDKHLLDQYQLNYYGNLRDFINAKPIEIPKSIALAGGAYFDIDSTDLVKLAQEEEEYAFVKLDSIALSTPIAAASRAIANDSTRNAIEFNYLPGTKKEVEQLTTAFKVEDWQTVTYTGTQASEDNIKILEGANAPGILHLATHGYFFNPYEKQAGVTLSDETMRERIIGAESPLLRSGLVFSGVNHSWKGGKPIAGLEDGVLTAFEIANMELWNTKLVVLSACETGLGDVDSAEGVFGLQRAFKAAGVDKLVISLWKIPDAQTAALMQLFYQNFLSGMPLAKALRTAQLTMSEKHSPFYWAGFVLIE